MTALAAPRSVRRMGDVAVSDLSNVPVKGGVKIYQGAAVVFQGGFAAPASAIANVVPIGIALATIDNTAGADGDKKIEVRRGAFKFHNDGSITQAQMGSVVFFLDDNTVAATNGGGGPAAGTALLLDSDGVWVQVGGASGGGSSSDLPVYTDLTRPAPTTAGMLIFNSDDNDINVANGTNWYRDGVIT